MDNLVTIAMTTKAIGSKIHVKQKVYRLRKLILLSQLNSSILLNAQCGPPEHVFVIVFQSPRNIFLGIT